MKIVVQRVKEASVTVEGKEISKIAQGLLVFLGIKEGDTEKEISWLIEKLLNLRIFNDAQGKLNLSVKGINGQILVVSQFTLYGDCSAGRRPSFIKSARPEAAEKLYALFCDDLSKKIEVQKGLFGADMKVSLINDGPVTLIIDREAKSSHLETL